MYLRKIAIVIRIPKPSNVANMLVVMIKSLSLVAPTKKYIQV